MASFWRKLNLSDQISLLYIPSEKHDREVLRERLHYENLKSMTDKHIDTVRYLYMRLNIVDGKVNYLLRINSITLGIVGIVIGIILSESSPQSSKQNTTSLIQQIESTIDPFWLVLIIFSLLFSIFISFLICFVMGQLRFDHITTDPRFLNGVSFQHLETNINNDRRRAMDPRTKPFKASHSETDILFVKDQVEIALQTLSDERRSISEYEDLFFRITIGRQRMLRWARFFTLTGWFAYSFFLGILAYSLLP